MSAPEADPIPAEYRPNSVHALIAAMMLRQDQMHAENLRARAEDSAQLDRTEEQVKATNGRVNRLEDTQEKAAARLKTSAKVAGALTTIVVFLFGSTLRERALLDVAAVRRLADEQISAAAPHRASAPVAPPGPPPLTRPAGP